MNDDVRNDQGSTHQPPLKFIEPNPKPVWFSLEPFDPDQPVTHRVMVGPTGSGKSALCNAFLIETMKAAGIAVNQSNEQENPSCE